MTPASPPADPSDPASIPNQKSRPSSAAKALQRLPTPSFTFRDSTADSTVPDNPRPRTSARSGTFFSRGRSPTTESSLDSSSSSTPPTSSEVASASDLLHTNHSPAATAAAAASTASSTSFDKNQLSTASSSRQRSTSPVRRLRNIFHRKRRSSVSTGSVADQPNTNTTNNHNSSSDSDPAVVDRNTSSSTSLSATNHNTSHPNSPNNTNTTTSSFSGRPSSSSSAAISSSRPVSGADDLVVPASTRAETFPHSPIPENLDAESPALPSPHKAGTILTSSSSSSKDPKVTSSSSSLARQNIATPKSSTSTSTGFHPTKSDRPQTPEPLATPTIITTPPPPQSDTFPHDYNISSSQSRNYKDALPPPNLQSSFTAPLVSDTSDLPASAVQRSSSLASNSSDGATRRRRRSTSFGVAKLTSLPLSPTLETPSPERGEQNETATNTAGSPSSFFSSVLSVAQNAAASLTNTITPASVRGGLDRAQTSTEALTAKDRSNLGSANRSADDLSSFRKNSGSLRNTSRRSLTSSAADLGILSTTMDTEPRESAASTPHSAQFPHPAESLHRHVHEARGRSESSPVDPSFTHLFDDTASRKAQSINGIGDAAPPSDGTYGSPPGTSASAGNNSTITTANANVAGGSIGRSGSIRSALNRRRHRVSSCATGVATAMLPNMQSSLSQNSLASIPPLQRPTGFAIANKKRNRTFHNLFKSVPDDDYLIEDYSCALQREILAQGRLYISEGYLCFSSNILGWVTNLVMGFDELVVVEKRNTALIFKNGLTITTTQRQYNFASFTSRDTTYDLIINIWRHNNPNIQSSLNGDRTEKTDAGEGAQPIRDHDVQGFPENQPRDAGDDSEDSDDYQHSQEGDDYDDDDYDEDLDHDDDVYDEEQGGVDVQVAAQGSGGDGTSLANGATVTANVNGAANGTNSTTTGDAETATAGGSGNGGRSGTRKTSGNAAVAAGSVAAAMAGATAGAASAAGEGAGPTDMYPGPTTNPATQCGDTPSHLDRHVAEDTIPAPLGKVYDLLFGAYAAKYMTRFLTDQGCTDMQIDNKGTLTMDTPQRIYTYTKPLNGPIGPKSTKCIVTENLEQLDFKKSANLLVTTQTPTVPYGNAFTVKTKYCLSWAENNSTRILVTCTIEWTGKSWIKGTIEKAAHDGQVQYCSDIFANLKSVVTQPTSLYGATVGLPRPSTTAGGSGGASGGMKKRKGGAPGRRGKMQPSSGAASPQSDKSIVSKSSDWGILEPIHPLLQPLINLIQPLLTGNMMYGLLVGLLVASWYSFGSKGSSSSSPSSQLSGSDAHYWSKYGVGPSHPYSGGVSYYEELWRREENALWEWLDERVGIDRVSSPPTGRSHSKSSRDSKKSHSPVSPPSAKGKQGGKSSEEVYRERNVEEAIRVTEEKLRLLKESMSRP